MKRILPLLSGFVAFALVSCSGNVDTQHFERARDFGRLDDSVTLYIQDVLDFGGTNEVNSVMVLKDGKILAEYYDAPYGPHFLNVCWSASKTFTATAVGFAVQDGLLSLEDKLVDYISADKLPETISDTLASLNLYDLMRMSSGLKIDPIGQTGSLREKTPTSTVLNAGFKFAPGERYSYNSHNTYLLGEVVSNVTGKRLSDYLNEKLFSKLGIAEYHWDQSAEGYDMGGWGLFLTTEGLAKMGQFFLQKGQWNGEQLLDSSWFDAAMSPQIYQNRGSDPDWEAGYGYQMWVGTHNTARLDGAWGQWVIVCPDKNAVIVITQHLNRTHLAMPSVWSRIYDAI